MRRTIYIATFNFFNTQLLFIFIVIIIFIIITSTTVTIISGSSSSNSISRSIIIIIIIISSSNINIISVSLTLSTSILSFSCFLLFYIKIPHHWFLRDHDGNKVAQLLCVIPAIAPYGELFLPQF